MKTLSIFFAVFFLIGLSCAQNQKSSRSDTFPDAQRFLDSLLEDGLFGKNIIFILHPSYCGSCTDTTINFINSLNFSENCPFFVFSSKDDVVLGKLFGIADSCVIFPDYYFMEKHGMAGPYSTFIKIEEGKVVAQENLIPEKFTIIAEI